MAKLMKVFTKFSKILNSTNDSTLVEFEILLYSLNILVHFAIFEIAF